MVRADRFGNVITNINREELQRFLGKQKAVIKVGDHAIDGLHRTYCDVANGALLALIGSSQYLEVAVNGGRASDRFGVREKDIIGMEVEVSKRPGFSRAKREAL